jgi:hypothetical protein
MSPSKGGVHLGRQAVHRPSSTFPVYHQMLVNAMVDSTPTRDRIYQDRNHIIRIQAAGRSRDSVAARKASGHRIPLRIDGQALEWQAPVVVRPGIRTAELGARGGFPGPVQESGRQPGSLMRAAVTSLSRPETRAARSSALPCFSASASAQVVAIASGNPSRTVICSALLLCLCLCLGSSR